MTAPLATLLTTAALLLVASAPLVGAGHLVPHLGSGTEHFVSVLVVGDTVRQIDLSVGLGCLVQDDPDSDPAQTLLVFECEPTDATLTTCASTALDVVQLGEGVEAVSECGDAVPTGGASCSVTVSDGICTDVGAGGSNPFRCAIYAQHPIVVYQVECKAYY